ncbi:MAG: anaerobic ribonucleoside-triphosphate reductase activating protein [Firmicutes bacterium]|nr:anaerobic ribonucleoside-triphosphate reductase activating protein [Bacillota bacterium]
MIIKGFQKLTLLDFPGRVAATVFTPGCDFRCPFCHNASLVLDLDEALDQDEILAFLKGRLGRLTGVAITGGEPLMQPDIADFMKSLKDMGYAVKLDTNGSFPQKLRAVLDEDLADYVAMDIKNCRGRYAETCGLPESASEGLLSNIDESIAILRSSGIDYEFRTTVVKELHRIEDIEAMGRWMAGNDAFYLQCFKDSGDILKPGLSAHSEEEMRALCDVFKAFVPKASLRGL